MSLYAIQGIIFNITYHTTSYASHTTICKDEK